MNTKALASLADLICRAQESGRQTPMGIAMAVDSAGRHMSPEVAAELAGLRVQVAELREERRTTNEWVDDAAKALRAYQARIAELEALKLAPIQTCRTCGAGYTYGEPCSTCLFRARMAAEVAARAERPVNRLTEVFAPTQALQPEGEHYQFVHHENRIPHDLPETGGERRA